MDRHYLIVDDHDNITHKPDREQLTTIFIDEGQFFDMNLSKVIEFIDRYYRENLGLSINIVCAGLDMDFRGEPFGPMPALMAQAELVDKLHAICMVCGESATRTQRLINGRPAHYHDPVVVVGASELYEARCRHHHDVPRD